MLAALALAVSLTWGAAPTGHVDSYLLEVNINSGGYEYLTHADPNVTWHTHSSTITGSVYQYRIRAECYQCCPPPIGLTEGGLCQSDMLPPRTFETGWVVSNAIIEGDGTQPGAPTQRVILGWEESTPPPSGARKAKLTPTSVVAGPHSDIWLVIDEEAFGPSHEIWTVAADGGGGLRFQDQANTKLPALVFDFDTVAIEATIKVKVPSLSAASEIWVLYGMGVTSQPARDANPDADGYQGSDFVYEPGVVAAWNFENDPTANIASDTASSTVAFSHNFESADLVDGRLGKAVTFDGVNEYLSTTDTSLNLPQTTVVAMVRAGSLSGGNKFVYNRANSSPGTVALILQNYGSFKYRGFVRDGATNIYESVAANPETSTTEWRAVTLAKDSVGVRFFIDGVKQPGAPIMSGDILTAGYQSFEIGRHPNNEQFLNGAIEMLAVYDSGKSDGYIQTISNNLLNPDTFWTVSAGQDQ